MVSHLDIDETICDEVFKIFSIHKASKVRNFLPIFLKSNV